MVAVSHGTDSSDGQVAVAGLIDAVRRRLLDVDVLDAFVDVQEPTLASVLERVPGASVVIPLLLAPGFHVHVDVARAIATRQATAAPVLGPDAAITAILLDRLDAVGLRDNDAVVLGVAGSSDVRARHSTDRAATRLAMALGREVRVGHLGGIGRPIGSVVAEAAASDRRIVVATYLLAPGHFTDLMNSCGADAVTPPLLGGGSPDDRLVQLVVDRYSEAAAAWQLRPTS